MATYTLTGSTDNFTGDASDDFFDGTPTTLTNLDRIDGAGGNNTLRLTASGTYDLSVLALIANIQTISSSVGSVTVTVSGGLASSPTLQLLDFGPGANTLAINNITIDTTGRTFANIQTLKGLDAGSTYTISQSQLNTTGGPITAIVGTGTGNILNADSSTFDLRGVTLTQIQTLQSSYANTAFLLNANQLNGMGGSLATVKGTGTTGTNLIRTSDTTLDVRALTLTNIQMLQSDTAGATFTVKNSQLGAPIVAINGTGTGNTLATAETALKIAGVTLHNIQTLKGTLAGTTFTVGAANLVDGGGDLTAITGTGANNVLATTDTKFDVHSLALTNVQSLSDATAGATFTVTKAQLGGSGLTKIVATGVGNTLLLDSASTTFSTAGLTLTNIQTLEAAANNAAITVDAAQLSTTTGGSLKTIKIDGGTTGTLTVTGKSVDVRGLTLTNVVSIGSDVGATYSVDTTQLVGGGGGLKAIVTNGTDNTLQSAGALFDLTGLATNGITTVKTTVTTGVTIKDNGDAHAIVGGTGKDILSGNGGADKFTGGGGADIFRDTSANLNGTSITDLASDDVINITNMSATGAQANFASGTLTVKNGSTSVAIALTGAYDSNFKITSDGLTGINIQYAGAGVATNGTKVRLTADTSKAVLVGTYGNDTFTGGTGTTDTVLENGTTIAGSTIFRDIDGTIVISGGNGVDRVTGAMERLRFDDGVLILNPTSAQVSIAGIYHVAYNRSPDEAGLNFQANALATTKNLSLLSIATNFLNSKEAVALTLPSLTDAQYINLLYQNSFGRAPDAGGFAVQLDALAHGITRAQLLLNFATSAEEVAVVGGPLQNAIQSAYPDPSLP